MGGSFSCCIPPRPPPGVAGPSGSAVHAVDLAASELFRLPGLATAYHTSVLVDGEEFFFSDSGIYADKTLISHQGKPSELLRIGYSNRTGLHLLLALSPHFRPGSYDLVRKNCNSFSDCALFFLLGKRLDGKYSALERLGQKVSPEMIRKVTKGMYYPNEAASGFRVDGVISQLKQLSDSDLAAACAAASAPPRSRQALSIGARVTVVGLRNAEALNGQEAVVTRYNGVSGRWEARLELSGEVKAFRAENLRPAGELVLQPGDAVRIHGLRTEAGQSLNGQEGHVVRYLHEVSRYEVQVGSGTKAVRAENLMPI